MSNSIATSFPSPYPSNNQMPNFVQATMPNNRGNPALTAPPIIEGNPTNSPTYSDHIIKHPEPNLTHGKITERYIIDSRDRDLAKYPNSNHYVVPIVNEFRDVVAVELTQAFIPRSPYNIHSYNNEFCFSETSGVILSFEIEPGLYIDGNVVATLLQNGLNSVGQSTYTVTFTPNAQKFVFTSDLSGGAHIFEIVLERCFNRQKGRDLYPQQSIGKILGFYPRDYNFGTGLMNLVSGSTLVTGYQTKFDMEFDTGDYFSIGGIIYQVASVESGTQLTLNPVTLPTTNLSRQVFSLGTHRPKNPYNINDDPYIVLQIPELKKLNSMNVPFGNGFQIINFYALSQPNVIKSFYEIRFFNPPIPRLSQMTIELRTYNGDLWDGGNFDHYLDFNITTLNQTNHYSIY
jgi:hypothetical protein